MQTLLSSLGFSALFAGSALGTSCCPHPTTSRSWGLRIPRRPTPSPPHRWSQVRGILGTCPGPEAHRKQIPVGDSPHVSPILSLPAPSLHHPLFSSKDLSRQSPRPPRRGHRPGRSVGGWGCQAEHQIPPCGFPLPALLTFLFSAETRDPFTGVRVMIPLNPVASGETRSRTS